jgi:hypothetical protein
MMGFAFAAAPAFPYFAAHLLLDPLLFFTIPFPASRRRILRLLLRRVFNILLAHLLLDP